MKALLNHKDGRLKTGRVALLIFILLLIGGSLLFKASRRIDTTLVAVKHVFEPPVEEEVEKHEPFEPAGEVKEPSEEEAESEQVVEEKVMEPDPSVQVAEALEQEPRAKSQELVISQNPEPTTPNPEPAFTPEPRTRNSNLVLAPQQYMELLQAWRGSGSNEEGKPSISLRVENLRETYALFQMKAVAVNVRGQMFDLADGSRLPETALDDYSAMVFTVDKPWPQWEVVLKSAKFRPGELVQVRYLMYPFVKNAIFARSRQAFEWCMVRKLLPEDTSPQQVDVLGRTYAINREGGGRFGVFVPVSLNAPGGKTIAISPEAFAGEADVEALRQAGML